MGVGVVGVMARTTLRGAYAPLVDADLANLTPICPNVGLGEMGPGDSRSPT